MKYLKLLVIIIFLGAVAAFVLMGRTGNGKITSPQNISQNQAAAPIPTPTPTPAPKTIDKSSNLTEETENLTPNDFSGDFKLLKEEAENF